MMCMNCGAEADRSFHTDVTDLGTCLIIVRNVPCFKCRECNGIAYTGDVVQKLERLVENARKLMQEISVIDYSKVA